MLNLSIPTSAAAGLSVIATDTSPCLESLDMGPKVELKNIEEGSVLISCSLICEPREWKKKRTVIKMCCTVKVCRIMFKLHTQKHDYVVVVCVYLSRQEEGAWGGQVTDRGMVALPSPETGLGSD